MRLRRFSRASLCVGAFAGSAAAPIVPKPSAPILALAGAFNAYPPQFDAEIDDTVAVGDTLQLQWASDVRFLSIVGSATNVIDAGEASANAASFTGLSAITSPAVNFFRLRAVRPNGDYSAWSNVVLHGAVADAVPAAFAFTDVTGASLSTVYTSNTVTLTGFNQPVSLSISDGEYAVSTDGGATFSAWSTATITVYPNDQIRVRTTSSASNSTSIDVTVQVGSTIDTYTVTTAGAASPPASSDLIAWLDADDLSTLYQLVTKATAVTADGQPVGTWADKSGAASDFIATANSGVRPTYRNSGGVSYLEGDGTAQMIARQAAIGIARNARTVMFMVNGTGLASKYWAADGSTSSNNPAFGFNGSGTDDFGVLIRNDANATPAPAPAAPFNGASDAPLDGNWHVVTLTSDGTGGFTVYVDNGSGAARSVSLPADPTTLIRFSLFGWLRQSGSQYAAIKFAGFRAWNRVLTSGERAAAVTQAGSKIGLSI